MSKSAQMILLVALLAALAVWRSPGWAQSPEPALASEITSAPSEDPLNSSSAAPHDASAASSELAPLDDPLTPRPATAAPRRRPRPSAPAAPITGPRDMLQLLGVDDSYFQMIQNGEPVEGTEVEALWRMLYAASRFNGDDYHQWLVRQWDFDQLTADPASQQGRIFELRGRVQRVVVEHPLPEVVERLEMPHFYRCEMLLDDSQEPAVVYAREVPMAWAVDVPIDEPARAAGFFFKLLGRSGQPATPVFVAARVGWLPAGLLGESGLDVSLFERVPQRTRMGIEDFECFYQTLAVMRDIGVNELLRHAQADLPGLYQKSADRFPKLAQQPEAKSEFHLAPLFADPRPYAGRLMTFNGTAVRATEVRVEDANLIRRFGIRHYWQVEVFVDLRGNYRLEKDERVFHSYPIVLSLLELPPGFPIGPRIHEPVTVPAVFMKLWVYQSEYSGERNLSQFAPLLISRSLIWHQPESAEDPYAGLNGAMIFVGALVGVWILVFWFNRADRRFKKRAMARELGLDVDPSEIGPPIEPPVEEAAREEIPPPEIDFNRGQGPLRPPPG